MGDERDAVYIGLKKPQMFISQKGGRIKKH